MDQNPYESPTAGSTDPRIAASKSTKWRWLGTAIAAIVGASVGWSLWVFSPTLFGHVEPWDGDYVGYIGWLFATGAFCGSLSPRAAWLPVLGIYIGQVVGAHQQVAEGPIIMPAVISIAVFGMVPALIGAALGWLLGRVLWKTID